VTYANADQLPVEIDAPAAPPSEKRGARNGRAAAAVRATT
jgi:hypothetical protein